jgi:hypothetical protein
MTSVMVDAHVNFWNTDQGPLPWLQPALGLRSVYLPDDLARGAGERPQGAFAFRPRKQRRRRAGCAALPRRLSGCEGVVLQYAATRGQWVGVVQPVMDNVPPGLVGGDPGSTTSHTTLRDATCGDQDSGCCMQTAQGKPGVQRAQPRSRCLTVSSCRSTVGRVR